MSDQLFFGLVLGLIGAVAIYHVLMFAVLRAHEFLAYGAYLVALAAFEVARTHLPQNSWFSWLSFAALAFFGYWLLRTFSGAFVEAAERFEAILGHDPDDGAARYLQARALDLSTAVEPWEGVDRAAK